MRDDMSRRDFIRRSVMVGVKDGKIMAVKGDAKSPVNQGALCVKGYSLPFIQYGSDRLTRPLVRMRGGRYDEQGELADTTWDHALELMAERCRAAIKEGGPESAAMSPSSGAGKV